MKIETYAGHVIDLDPADKKFVVSGPLFEKDGAWLRTFDTYEAATNKIDKRLKAAARQKRENLKLPVLLSDGITRASVKTIGKEGTLVFDPSMDARAPHVYPDVPWIGEKLKAIAELQAQLRALVRTVQPFQIDHRYSYRGYTEEHAEKLKAEHADKTAKAIEAAPKPELKAVS